MKYTDIKAMSDEELAKKLEEGRAELFNLRFQARQEAGGGPR